MDHVGQSKSQVRVRALEKGSEKHLDEDARDLVLDRKGDARCLSASHQAVFEMPLTCRGYTPSSVVQKPFWIGLYHHFRNRLDTLLSRLNRHMHLTPQLFDASPWLTRCAVVCGPLVPIRSMKLFIRPAQLIYCEFTVKGEMTRGEFEGAELVSDKPLMRLHFSYKSPRAQLKVNQFKQVLLRGAPFIQNPFHLQQIWNMSFSNKKIAQGYEFVSRLYRFGPTARRTARRLRLTPWSFAGVYENLDPLAPEEQVNIIRFMNKYARRDRSVKDVRVIDNSKTLQSLV